MARVIMRAHTPAALLKDSALPARNYVAIMLRRLGCLL